MLGLYIMSFDAIYMYITFTGKSYLSRLGLPMDWEKIFEKWKQHTVLQYIPLRGEMFVFFPPDLWVDPAKGHNWPHFLQNGAGLLQDTTEQEIKNFF